LNNADKEAALINFDLSSARVIRKNTVKGSAHLFNDLAIATSGEV